MVPFISLPYIWMALSSIPIVVITVMITWMEIGGTMEFNHLSFWKFKFLMYVMVAWGVYSCVRVLTTNPGVTERVFYELEQSERRRYAINKLRGENLLEGDKIVDNVIRGMEGSTL